jgi:hypothetical protein
MIIQTTQITEALFVKAFQSLRPDSFTVPGLEALFELLEGCCEHDETPLELDVIAIYCDYSEYTLQETIKLYGIDVDDIEEDELAEVVEEYLNDNVGMWVKTSEDQYIIQA